MMLCYFWLILGAIRFFIPSIHSFLKKKQQEMSACFSPVSFGSSWCHSECISIIKTLKWCVCALSVSHYDDALSTRFADREAIR